MFDKIIRGTIAALVSIPILGVLLFLTLGVSPAAIGDITVVATKIAIPVIAVAVIGGTIWNLFF